MEGNKDVCKEFLSPTKTSPLIIRVSPQKVKPMESESSSVTCLLKTDEANLLEGANENYKFDSCDEKASNKSLSTIVSEESPSVILTNSSSKKSSSLSTCTLNGDLVETSEQISQNKETKEIITRGIPNSKATDQNTKVSVELDQSSAKDTKTCPLKLSKKRKLSEIQTLDSALVSFNVYKKAHLEESQEKSQLLESVTPSKIFNNDNLPEKPCSMDTFNEKTEESEMFQSQVMQDCPLSNSNDAKKLSKGSNERVNKGSSGGETNDLQKILNSSGELDCAVGVQKSTESAELDQPPLVMQSSNLLFIDELDNRHGGGGIETTRKDEAEPLMKKLKICDKDSEILSNAECNDSEVYDSLNLGEKEQSPSESTSDPLNSEQNRVMEFDILDESESDDNEANQSDSDDSDLSMDEIDAMLEEGFQSKGVDKELEEKEKVILKVRGRDHFDVLPEGWIEVTHNSGMPIYLHKQSRVCSVSKPYFLGPGSTRKHEIPVSAIPCLHYLKEIEKENSLPTDQRCPNEQETNNHTEPEKTDSTFTSSAASDNVNEISEKPDTALLPVTGNKDNLNTVNNALPSAKLESVKETKESGSLDYIAVREYCQRRFEFQTIVVKRFKTWSGRRKHQKMLKRKQRPYLPDNTKLITCPLYSSTDKGSTLGNNTRKEFIMNPIGKSPICILHEYVQHTLRVQPKYVFKELESASTPYGAVVTIDDIEYGCGFGSSKKLAKSDAARCALEILIPKMKLLKQEDQSEETQDVEFFDQVRVEDPRVCDLSIKAGQPYPYQILLECLKRNYGMGDTEIEFSMNNLKHQKNEFFMKVGKHEVSVVCKNKRDGKHRAAQAILQRLHPHVKSWGSLLRMYGKGSCKTLKEKKEEEQRITELQSQACINKPNMSILNKLKEEMLKYRQKMMSKKPIGKLIPERMEFFSTSNSNLNNVEL